MNYNDFLDVMLESDDVVSHEEHMKAIELFSKNPKIQKALTKEDISWIKRSAFMGLKREIYDKIIELSKK